MEQLNLLKQVHVLLSRTVFLLTSVILVIIFYFIFSPVGIGMRLFGIDPLDRKIDKQKNSYWDKAEKEKS